MFVAARVDNVSDMTNAPPHPWPSLQRAARDARISYAKLAELVGISSQSVTAYARGTRNPSEETIAAIAEALNVPYDELRADVPFATTPQDMLDEIDGLVTVLAHRMEKAATAFREIQARRAQLEALAQVSA